jgi:hypothetical protein
VQPNSPYIRETEAHRLTVQICQTGSFALFGVQNKFPVFLLLTNH